MSSTKTGGGTGVLLLIGVVVVAVFGFGGVPVPDVLPNFVQPEAKDDREETVCVQASFARASVATMEWDLGPYGGAPVYDGKDWSMCQEIKPGSLAALRVKKHEEVSVTCRIYHTNGKRIVPKKAREATAGGKDDCRVEWVVTPL